jgi:hypothetical protein
MAKCTSHDRRGREVRGSAVLARHGREGPGTWRRPFVCPTPGERPKESAAETGVIP